MQLDNFHFHLVTHPRKGYVEHQKVLPHKHPFYELGIIIQGKCKWNFENRKSAIVKSGEGILVAPGEVHAEDPLTFCNLAWIGFNAPKEELRRIKLHQPLKFSHQFKDIKELVERLESENTMQFEENDLRMKLHLAELTLLLRRCTSRKRWKSPTMDYNSRLVESAALYLDRNCTADMPIEQVARYHGLSHSHFGALFRCRFGLSPKAYQQRSKLRYLSVAISSGMTGIKELAEEGKFEDIAYFCRWIKRQTGLYPKAWIKRHNAGDVCRKNWRP